jgi:hypothetical protein
MLLKLMDLLLEKVQMTAIPRRYSITESSKEHTTNPPKHRILPAEWSCQFNAFYTPTSICTVFMITLPRHIKARDYPCSCQNLKPLHLDKKQLMQIFINIARVVEGGVLKSYNRENKLSCYVCLHVCF